jgi:hypothetical protein
MGPAVALGHAQIGQQERDRLGRHRGAPVGVDGQLIGGDVLVGDGVGQQPLGQEARSARASSQPGT